MNPSDWRKAAILISQHKQVAATAETDQLSSMPLSEIAIDDSGPLVAVTDPGFPIGGHAPIRGVWTPNVGTFW